MPDPAKDLAARSRTLLLGLFLFSGVSGLIYQVVWTRMFSLVLGTTVHSVAVVLGVFMGGLALGSYLFGKRVDRPGAHGVRMYGWLEIGIGAYALVLPLLMALCDSLFRAGWPTVAGSPAGQLLLRLLLAALVLLVPTTLMGGTLPALSRFLVRRASASGREIGNLYAINTLGALVGCFVTGFFLLEWFGIRATLFGAGALNLIVGGLALHWSRRMHNPEPAVAEPTPPDRAPAESVHSTAEVRLVLVVFTLSGFAALTLEVLWTRALMYFVSVDTWAFTAMLTAFLAGIGGGSLVMARLIHRVRSPLLALAVIEILVGVTAAASIPLLRLLYGLTPDLGKDSFAAVLISKLIPSFAIMLVPALLMGAAFPVVSHIYVGARRAVGQGTGTLYACNTVGAIAGSLAAGFVLIPALGIQAAILLVASSYVVLGLIVLVVAAPRQAWIKGVAAAGLLVVVAGNALFENRPMVAYGEYLFPTAPLQQAEKWQLIYHRENADASIAVIENHVGTRALNINGVVTAADNYLDMQVHRMLSHLPILMHPEPQQVLIVGFGMGSTVWGSCQHDLRVDVVELLREEKNTAEYFAKINHGVLDPLHERLDFIAGDGRNYLLATDKRYDVISFNAIHPRFSANLYTRDFYQMCRERLTDDGVICAWMTQNSMLDREWRMLCRSFVDVFPQSSMWYCNPEHFCLIGQRSSQQIDLSDWRRRMAVPGVARDLHDSSLSNPYVLLSRYMFGGQRLRDYVAGAPLNTDDHPLIEFVLEQRYEERLTSERMAALVESVLPMVTGVTAEERREVERRQAATAHLIRGQIEFWYPQSPPAASRVRSEIAHRRAFLMYPDNQDIRENLALQATLRQRYTSRLARDANDAVALENLGRMAMEDGDLDTALRHLERSLRVDPRAVSALRTMALIRFFRGEYLASMQRWDQFFETLGQLNINNAVEQYFLGEAIVRNGDPKGKTLQSRALRQLPEAKQLFELIGSCVLRK